MRRYSAYDPPEYVSWQPDPELLEEYRSRVRADDARAREIAALPPDAHIALYRGLLRFRLSDIALTRWVKQGVISKAWLGTGEEAVTVGAVNALDRRGSDGDIVGPMIRNQGANHEMGMPMAEVFRTYLGTADAPAGGRDLPAGGKMVHGAQRRARGGALDYARRSVIDGSRTLAEVLELVHAAIERDGLDVLDSRRTGDLACFRRHELAAALNRLRTLEVRGG